MRPDTATRPARDLAAVLHPRGVPTAFVLALVPAAAALNIVAGSVQVALSLPVFLDMIGTCVAAILLGPWWGALVGVMTGLGAGILRGPTEIPFGLANAAGALVWGYGIRSLGLGRWRLGFFGLNLATGIVVSGIAGVIAFFVFGGATGHPSDVITVALVQAGQELLTAVLASSTIAGVADKIISGYVALAIIGALPPDLSAGIALPRDEGLRRVLLVSAGIVAAIAVVIVYLLAFPPAPA